jgi:hypothetical protein
VMDSVMAMAQDTVFTGVCPPMDMEDIEGTVENAVLLQVVTRVLNPIMDNIRDSREDI